MKHLVLSIGILFSIFCYGQEKGKIAFYEFNLSANYTTVANSNTENRLGFGAGVNYAFRPGKKLNVVSGIEYNRTSIYKEHIDIEGPHKKADQATYYLNNISIPLIFRYNFSPNSTFFAEAGVFIDVSIYSQLKGNYTTFSLGSSSQQYARYEAAPVKNFNYGPSLGLGVAIPVGRYYILVKCDYKWGIRDIDLENHQLYNRYMRLSLGFRI